MPSKEIYEKCMNAGYSVDKIAYEKYDSLLSQTDLELLFELLTKFRDINGNHPVITANCVVANPDFDKIKRDNFQTYHYELITTTFKRYPEHANNFELWHKGMENKIFWPQFHCREHLNVSLFMDALRKGEPAVHFGFENMMPGNIISGPNGQGNYFVESTNYSSLKDKEEKLSYFVEGLDLFENLFGYRSFTIIPPSYIWSPDFNDIVFRKGVFAFQGIRKMREPLTDGKYKYHNLYLGKKNDLGQVYLVRNAIFEPSLFKTGIKDPVNRCLVDMSIAFKMRHPAIISSHRINYVGFIDKTNRDTTLKMLHQIISIALKKWPDIEFFTSDRLAKLIFDQTR